MQFRFFFAPGRVNLIGEHLDYNGGNVFPCAITLGTYLAARKRKDRKIRLYSVNKPKDGVIVTSLDTLLSKDQGADGTWADYPKGVIATFLKKGYHVDAGLDLIYYGNIPAGAGLSSSASIEVVTAVMLNGLFGLEILNQEIAACCRLSENTYNGVHCGIMDQFVSAMGKAEHAIFLDTGDLSFEYVKLDMKGLRLVIANTNKPHKLADSKYNERQKECEKALTDLKQVVEISALCDLTPEMFEKYKDAIKDPVCQKRAKHVVYENMRTIQAVRELSLGNMSALGELMKQAHLSMKNDFEATGIELDTLAEEAWKAPGCVGARMTGAGFGGCIVAIVQEDLVKDFIGQVGAAYKEKIGYAADFYEMEIGRGPRELTAIDGNPRLEMSQMFVHMLQDTDAFFSDEDSQKLLEHFVRRLNDKRVWE